MGSAVSVPQKSQTIAQMEGTWHKLEKEPTGLWRLIAIIVAALFAAPKILSISVENGEKLAFSRTKGGIFRRSKNQIIDLSNSDVEVSDGALVTRTSKIETTRKLVNPNQLELTTKSLKNQSSVTEIFLRQ